MSRGPSPEVRFAIDDLYVDYLWALDTQHIDRYVGTFWDDAVFEETQLDGVVETWTGAAAIREFTEAHFGGYAGHQHRETNRMYLPHPDGGDRWILRSYWMTTHREDGEVALTSTGHSKDVVERRDGQWRFAARWLQRWPGDVAHPLAD